jgi:hypothetical protein
MLLSGINVVWERAKGRKGEGEISSGLCVCHYCEVVTSFTAMLRAFEDKALGDGDNA